MKLKIIVAIVTKLLKMPENENGERADMYLPEKLLAGALVLMAVGLGFLVAFLVVFNPVFIAVSAACILLGIGALMCWKNQTIRIIDEEKFEYTTFLGNKKVYAFSDIKGLIRNSDSLTLLVKDKKVHIESMAILSERLIEKINEALKTKVNE